MFKCTIQRLKRSCNLIRTLNKVINSFAKTLKSYLVSLVLPSVAFVLRFSDFLNFNIGMWDTKMMVVVFFQTYKLRSMIFALQPLNK